MSTPHALDAVLGRVLGAGSAISTILLGAGLAMRLVAPSVEGGTMLMRAGLVILLATPIARVLATTVAYLRARDWRAATMTGAVLLVLMVSVTVALLP
jgi:uncharacterized membrane protein